MGGEAEARRLRLEMLWAAKNVPFAVAAPLPPPPLS